MIYCKLCKLFGVYHPLVNYVYVENKKRLRFRAKKIPDSYAGDKTKNLNQIYIFLRMSIRSSRSHSV